MADQFTIPDPDEFPVVFGFKRRSFRPYDVPTVAATFVVDPEPVAASIGAAVYRYDSKYGLDVDPFGNDVPAVPVGRRILFEATANSSTLSVSSLIVKTWSSSSAIFISGSVQVGNIRQGSSGAALVSSFYAGSSLFEFDAETVLGVDYYPTVVPHVVASTFYDVNEGFQSFSVAPGASIDKTMAAADNAGICWVWFAMTPEWYLNEARTISAASVPESIDMDPVDVVVRLIITKDGRFLQTGQITSDGSAFFTNIIRDADSEGQAQVSYVAFDADDSVFVSTQENVRIDGNGLPIQTGNDSAVYLLDNKFPDPDSSSSSNSSSSSESSSSSCSSSSTGSNSFSSESMSSSSLSSSSGSSSSSSSLSLSSSSSSSQSGGAGCLQVLNNPMGGITTPFCTCYIYGGKQMTYTPNQAGGSGPGAFWEGWTVGGVGWVPGDPEIFFFTGTWYLYNMSIYPTFSSFINGTDGCGGMNFGASVVTCC